MFLQTATEELKGLSQETASPYPDQEECSSLLSLIAGRGQLAWARPIRTCDHWGSLSRPHFPSTLYPPSQYTFHRIWMKLNTATPCPQMLLNLPLVSKLPSMSHIQAFIFSCKQGVTGFLSSYCSDNSGRKWVWRNKLTVRGTKPKLGI